MRLTGKSSSLPNRTERESNPAEFEPTDLRGELRSFWAGRVDEGIEETPCRESRSDSAMVSYCSAIVRRRVAVQPLSLKTCGRRRAFK